eukprot:CAMPEP_0172441548 /NCGR_PEP_ID=MMETSP1065-20121228/2104_1 /TAXON_ID=265537 /ORGANISM="Amphiprora paludosa, Strain CCMP125" /LENGTH=40 /DNA_ID= /DNA_START= /DNA_END= /DNA_ORIENTATION=
MTTTTTTTLEDPTANTGEEVSTREIRLDHLRQALALYQKT